MVNFSNQRIYEDLLSVGVKPGKKFMSEDMFDSIPEKYRVFFAIGIFDGDGCICFNTKGKQWIISFCNGSRKTVESFSKVFQEMSKVSDRKITKRKDADVYSIAWTRQEEVQSFARIYLEMPDDITLERKRLKMRKMFEEKIAKSI
jgi:hypothetical protein